MYVLGILCILGTPVPNNYFAFNLFSRCINETGLQSDLGVKGVGNNLLYFCTGVLNKSSTKFYE